jgi:CheY-like chemotaxis protein
LRAAIEVLADASCRLAGHAQAGSDDRPDPPAGSARTVRAKMRCGDAAPTGTARRRDERGEMAGTDQHDEWEVAEGATGSPRLRVLLYSDHVETRQAVVLAAGRRVAKDLPPVEWVQVATAAAVMSTVEAGGLDLLVLDGEAGKVGGMSLCRQVKDEVFRCPPVLVLIGRPQDAWLASWSQADGVVCRPLDPIVLQEALADLLRRTAAAR